MNETMSNNTQGERNQDTHSKDELDLVIARLEATPPNARLAVGGKGAFSAGQLIEHIKANDDIGAEIINIQLDYLRSLKDLPTQDNVSTDYQTSS